MGGGGQHRTLYYYGISNATARTQVFGRDVIRMGSINRLLHYETGDLSNKRVVHVLDLEFKRTGTVECRDDHRSGRKAHHRRVRH